MKLVSPYCEQVNRRIYNIAVIKYPFIHGNFLKRLINAKRRPIWTMRGHSLNNIGNTQYSCLKHYLVPPEIMRITRAVKSFMVLQYDICYRPLKVNPFEYLEACLGMLLDQRKFRIIKFSWFA